MSENTADLEASIQLAIDMMTSMISEKVKEGVFESMELTEEIVRALYKNGLSHNVLIHHVNSMIIRILTEESN